MKMLDEEVEHFFSEMKAKDKRSIPVPEFKEMTSTKKRNRDRYLIPLGIAASGAILAMLFFQYESFFSNEDINSQTVLLMGDQTMHSTTELLEKNEPLAAESWDFPTSTLIDEFN
jgi:hypothetical protein